MSAQPLSKKKGLTPSEKRNLVIFLAVLFVLGNLFAVGSLQERFQDTSRNIRKLRADLAYDKVWIADRDLWTKRAEWIAKTQPKPGDPKSDNNADPGQGSARLLEALQQSAKKNNLVIAAQTLQEPRSAPFYREFSVQLSLTGSLESLCRWLAEIEQPELFQAVSRFSLRCEGADGRKMRCELTVARWYALK